MSGGPMTEAMYYVLLALHRPAHGYQLMQQIARASRGRVQMGPGTLYGVLTVSYTHLDIHRPVRPAGPDE